MIFLAKDPSLIEVFIEGLIKFWPLGNYTKEVRFLSELEEGLQFAGEKPELLKNVIEKLLKRLAKCISSNHFRVSDQALSLFEKESFINIIKYYKNESFTVLVPLQISELLNKNMAVVKTLTELLNLVKSNLRNIDKDLFESLRKINIRTDEKLRNERDKVENKWMEFTEKVIKGVETV